MRRDLVIQPQWFGARRYWVIKDPVALRYFRLRNEEYAILSMLDGNTGLAEMKAQFDKAFAPRRMTTVRLQGFLTNLYRNGLLLSDGLNQGEQLFLGHLRQRRNQRVGAVANILAIRFPGFDPDPILRWLYPKLRWCFTPWFLAGCLAIAMLALALVLGHADELSSRLPEFHAFVSARNLMWLAVALAGTKVLHELGHALTCKHFGGECHEMGIMLLVFTPCLYCNVTDAWILRSHWQRIAISAAGILVEIMLASIATFLWWFSHPGLINSICLNVMVVCAVGTLLLNGNPLLRYDGYFILSDLIEVPNLWQESRAVVRRWVGRWLLGIDLAEPAVVERRATLAIYGMASILYRIGVIIAILVLLYKALEVSRLQILAHIVTASVVVGIVSTAIIKGRRFFEDPLTRRQIRVGRCLTTCGALTLLAIGFFWVPFACRIGSPVMLEPRDARRVYVSAPGAIVASVVAGQSVKIGQPLVWLEDSELRMKVISLSGKLNRMKARVSNLESRAVTHAEALAQLPAAREMVADLQQQLAQRAREEQALTLKAPIDGTIIPPPAISPAGQNRRELRRWIGTPLEQRNIGCTLERGTFLCLVGDPRDHEAVVFVDESDIELVRVGQQVRMQFDVAPGIVLSGTIHEIAEKDAQVVPRELAAQREIANRPDSTGVRRPLQTSYRVRVKLDEPHRSLLIGARGQAKIVVDPQPLSRRLYRLIRRTLTLPI